jgi:hypothetical protein
VDEADPEGAEPASRVPMGVLYMRMRVLLVPVLVLVAVVLAAPRAQEQPYRQVGDDDGDGGLRRLLRTLGQMAVEEQDG